MVLFLLFLLNEFNIGICDDPAVDNIDVHDILPMITLEHPGLSDVNNIIY